MRIGAMLFGDLKNLGDAVEFVEFPNPKSSSVHCLLGIGVILLF